MNHKPAYEVTNQQGGFIKANQASTSHNQDFTYHTIINLSVGVNRSAQSIVGQFELKDIAKYIPFASILVRPLQSQPNKFVLYLYHV